MNRLFSYCYEDQCVVMAVHIRDLWHIRGSRRGLQIYELSERLAVKCGYFVFPRVCPAWVYNI